MRYLVIVIIFSIFNSICLGQISFFNFYTNNGADFGQGIIQLEDSSYVLTGSSSSFGNGPSQAFLMQIDSMGNYLWSKSYGGVESESGRRVLYKKDFGYFICGYSNSNLLGDFDFYLAKVDTLMNLEWDNTYGGDGWERINDAVLTSDTGTILVGETSSNVTNNLDIYIVRTNKLGDTIWTKTIGGSGDDKANCITRYDDSTYFIGGQYYLEDSLQIKGYMIYLKDDGTIIWQETIPTSNEHWVNDIVIDNSNLSKVVGVGGGRKSSHDIEPYYFIYDDAPNQSFFGDYHESKPGDEYYTEITSFGSNGDYYISYVDNTGTGYPYGEDIQIHRRESNWVYVPPGCPLSHPYPDYVGDIISTSDGGAIVIGYTTGVISGGNEIMVAKIGPESLYPDNINDYTINNVVIVENLDLSNLVTLYPNPSSGEVNLVSETNLYEKYRIISSKGHIVKSGFFNQNLNLDFSLEEMGVYFIELTGSTIIPVRIKLVIN